MVESLALEIAVEMTLEMTNLLSVVVIGRNEGARLERCLTSIQEMEKPAGCVEVVYVDSASTDGSVALAAALGARVIRLQTRRPTAALARNAGWRVSTGAFILFLDGDTILHPRFVVDSLPDFGARTAIVCGNRREIHPEVSIYNRVLDLDWMSRPGIVDYCGGDALVRREALEAAGGYDETLIAGEEPEMCRRLRAAGWEILHSGRPMTGHDLAMTKWAQYWRRCRRTGYAYAEVSERFRGSGLPFWENEARHNRNRAVVLSLLAAASVFCSLLLASVVPLLAMLLAGSLLAVRTAGKVSWKSPDFRTRFLYGIHSHLQQMPIYAGQREYWRDRRRGRTRGLIEYKEAASQMLDRPDELTKVHLAEDHAETVRRSLSRNVAVDVAARIGYLLSRFFIPPFVLARVTLEAYGLWSTAFIVVSYVGLSTMGISSVYIKFVAEYSARRQYDKANQLLSTGLSMTIPFCLAVFGVFYLLWPRLSYWLHIAPGQRGDAREVVLSVVAIFLASLSLGAFHDAVVGAQRTDQVQKRWVVCYVVETILIFILVGSGRGVRGLSEAFLIRTVIDVALCLIMARRLLPWMRLSPRSVTREALHTLFSFGGVVQIQGLLSVTLGSIERALAAPLIGLGGAGLLDIGKKLPGMAGSVPLAFAASFTPAASYLHGGLKDSPEQARNVRELYLRGARYMNLASAYLCGLLVAAPGPILKIWMGKTYPGAAYLVVLFALSGQVNLMTGPGTSILKGIGRPKEEFHYSIPNVLALMITVPLSRLILGEWTVLGIATAAAAATVAAAAYFLWHANRLLLIPFHEYWRTVVWPGLLPYAVAAPFGIPALYAATHANRWAAAGWIAVLGVLYSVLLIFAMDRFVWNAAERAWIRARVWNKAEAYFARRTPAWKSEA